MRINQFVAASSTLSRRAADQAIMVGRVKVNDSIVGLGYDVQDNDRVLLDNQPLVKPSNKQTIMLNKPVGYVCSKDGQGSKTIYDLLPAELKHLNPVGRLDKDSSGLLLLTNDGELAHKLTHPSFQKSKVYEVKLDKQLQPQDFESITKSGVLLDDGNSKMKLEPVDVSGFEWQITMSEGRNRQIRRTFDALGYKVIKLHRANFGPYALGEVTSSNYKIVDE